MKHTRVVSTKCTPGFACRAFSDTTLVCFIVNEHTTKCSRYRNTCLSPCVEALASLNPKVYVLACNPNPQQAPRINTNDPSHATNSLINSSSPSAAYLCRWTGATLLQVMSCRLFGAKPLPDPMLIYWPFANKFRWKSKYETFHSWKSVWNCRLRNDGHFVHGEMS